MFFFENSFKNIIRQKAKKKNAAQLEVQSWKNF